MLDRGGIVAERLIGAGDVDLGAVVGRAGRERVVLVKDGLVEIAGGKSFAAALGGSLFDASIASTRPRSYSRRIRCLGALERVDLLLHLLDLGLLLLDQILGRCVLVAAASGADRYASGNGQRE